MSNKIVAPHHTQSNTEHSIGIILWGTKNIYYVLPYTHNTYTILDTSCAPIECRIKGKRGYTTLKEHTYLLAGDIVTYQKIEPTSGIILDRLPRKNSIMRRKSNTLQPIAVNIDTLLIVSSLDSPPFEPSFIDRMIYIARSENIDIILIMNKLDILIKDLSVNLPTTKIIMQAIPQNIQSRLEVYRQLHMKILFMSALNKIGVSELQKHIVHTTTAIAGMSGVGKSSIMNCMIPHAQRRTGAISQKYNRGTHVTTRPELIAGDNFNLIDTPGIKQLFPIHTDPTTFIDGFPDIYKYAQVCKLPNCTHRNEPHCGVLPEIGNKIHRDRYRSYVSIRESIEQYNKSQWNRNKN